MSQVTTLKPQRNCSIDIFRFIATTCAVMAHSEFLMDISPTFYHIFINGVLGRYVVQFFTCISGYFFCKALLSGKNAFKAQFPRMLKIYIVWTIIYYIASFVQSVLISGTPITQFLVERVLFFFTVGSYPHLWSFPAILYSMIIMCIVFKIWKEKGLFILSISSILLFFIGALGSPYYTLFKDVGFIWDFFNWEGFFAFRSVILIGLPFASMGYLFNRFEKILQKLDNKKIMVYLSIAVIIYIIESSIMVLFFEGIERPYSQFATYAVVFFLFLTLLRFPMIKYTRFSEMARRFANFLFFFHPLLLAVSAVGFSILNIEFSGTLLFFIIQGLSMLAGYILIKIDTSWSNTLLGLPAKKAKTTSSETLNKGGA